MRASIVTAAALLVLGFSEGRASISVEATLSGFDPQWFWSINQGNRHADGLGCRARFVLLTPAAHAGKEVEILFHAIPDDVRKEFPGLGTDIGSTYSFELPDDFFDQDHRSIYSISVKNLKKQHDQPVDTNPGNALDARSNTMPRARKYREVHHNLDTAAGLPLSPHRGPAAA